MNKRELAIIERRLYKGASCKEIGKEFNLSRQRVRQIINAYHKEVIEYTKRKQRIKKNINKESANIFVSYQDLSTQAKNVLRHLKIKQLQQLTKYTAEELLAYRNFGRKALKEIISLLKMRGLKLREKSS